MYRSIGFDDLDMEDTNNNDATEDNSIPTTNDVLQDVNYKRKKTSPVRATQKFNLNGYNLASATSVVTFF